MDLEPEDSAKWSTGPASGRSRQQRRGLIPPEPRPHRRLQILEHRPPLLPARRHHRPDPLTPTLSPLTPRPLRYVPVYHHEPDRLLRQVVRRLHPWRRHEPEVGSPHASPTASPGSGSWRSDGTSLRCRLKHLRPAPLPGRLRNSAGEHSSRSVDHPEKLLATLPAAVGHKPGLRDVRQRHQELDVADQMGQAELQARRRTHACNGDRPRSNRSPAPRRTPRPAPRSAHRRERVGSILNRVYSLARKHQVHIRWPLLLVSGFIHVEDGLPGQGLRAVPGRDRPGPQLTLAMTLAQLAAGDGHPDDIAEELADGGVRGVADALEVGDRAGSVVGRPVRPGGCTGVVLPCNFSGSGSTSIRGSCAARRINWAGWTSTC